MSDPLWTEESDGSWVAKLKSGPGRVKYNPQFEAWDWTVTVEAESRHWHGSGMTLRKAMADAERWGAREEWPKERDPEAELAEARQHIADLQADLAELRRMAGLHVGERPDGLTRLSRVLYGRDPLPGDYVGGPHARILHDAAKAVALLGLSPDELQRKGEP